MERCSQLERENYISLKKMKINARVKLKKEKKQWRDRNSFQHTFIFYFNFGLEPNARTDNFGLF